MKKFAGCCWWTTAECQRSGGKTELNLISSSEKWISRNGNLSTEMEIRKSITFSYFFLCSVFTRWTYCFHFKWLSNQQKCPFWLWRPLNVIKWTKYFLDLNWPPETSFVVFSLFLIFDVGLNMNTLYSVFHNIHKTIYFYPHRLHSFKVDPIHWLRPLKRTILFCEAINWSKSLIWCVNWNQSR